jgi:ribosomal protein S18 acetylase RimI-like enzyme
MIKYRKAEIADLDAVFELVTSAIEEMEREGIHQWDNVYPAKADLKADIESGTLTVGMDEDDIAVIYVISKEFDEQYKNGRWQFPESDFRIIHRLCVSPKYQHRGLAKQTLSHIEDHLKSIGVDSIRLDVFTENPYALKLYRNNGYTEVGHADWRKGRFLLMEKRI